MRTLKNSRRRLAGSVCTSVVAAAALLMSAGTAHAHYPRVELNELTHTADAVLIGTVSAKTPWTGENGTTVFTDITLTDVEVLVSSDRAHLDGGDVVITMAGGDDGVRAMTVCCSPNLEVGQRYILFTLHDGQRYANPILGGTQGVYRVVGDQRGGELYPVTALGQGVVEISDGHVHTTDKVLQIVDGIATIDTPDDRMVPAPVPGEPGRESAHSRVTEDTVPVMTLEQFKDAIRDIARGPAPADPVLRGVGRFGGQPEFNPGEKLPVHEPGGRPLRNGLTPAEPPYFVADTPLSPEDRLEWERSLNELTEVGPAAVGPVQAANDALRASLCYCGYFDLYLTMEQVPTSWWSYNENNDSMYEYNQIMDIYRYVADDGSFGNNSENEFCGWLSQSTLNSVYGFNWGSSLALTITWYPSGCPCCELSQADIMFNSAYTWTENFDAALGNSSLINYKPVVFHELGHSWGAQRGSCTEDYSYSQLSVMHAYYNNIVENGFGMHAWDAWALRDLYDADTSILARQDMGVESYYTSGGSLTNSFTNTSTYYPGDTITLNNLTVENMSSSSTSDVRIRLYLSTNNIISTGDYQMGSYWSWSSFGSAGWWSGDLTTSIPSSIPPGEYYVGMIVTRGGASYLGDDYGSNNATYFRNKITVIPLPPPNNSCSNSILVGEGTFAFDTTGATTDGYTHSSCQFDGQTYNDIWYRFTPACDGRLTVSTCDQASYDTDLVLYRYTGLCPPLSSQVLACNDDAAGCTGYTSELSATVNRGDVYMIRVGGYASDDEGPGFLTVDLTPIVPNDNCVAALPIYNGDTAFDTTCATTDGLAHSSCQFDGQTYNDIWYTYTAPCTGTVTISTCGQAEYDTDLVLYTTGGACPPGNAQMVACNDDASGCSNYSSKIVAGVVAGRTYRLRVGGYNAGSAGEGVVTIDCAPVCGDANG
ncbi:MAG: hypothetical protein KDA21_12580, partial [Phycisphaerales bacterium]|nr:hypothetical protein [Phycisphaerales bacterium]